MEDTSKYISPGINQNKRDKIAYHDKGERGGVAKSPDHSREEAVEPTGSPDWSAFRQETGMCTYM